MSAGLAGRQRYLVARRVSGALIPVSLVPELRRHLADYVDDDPEDPPAGALIPAD